MKVKELRELLNGVPDDMEVWINAEGQMILHVPAHNVIIGKICVIFGNVYHLLDRINE